MIEYLKRINADRDYLIIAPKIEAGMGYHHHLCERAFLIQALTSFLEQHPDLEPGNVTIYELREVNERAEGKARIRRESG